MRDSGLGRTDIHAYIHALWCSELLEQKGNGPLTKISLPNGRDAFHIMLLDDFLVSNGKETVEGPEAVSGRDAGVIAQGTVEEVTYRLLEWTATQ